MNLALFLAFGVASFTVLHEVVCGFDENYYVCIPGLKASYGVSFPRGQISKRQGSSKFPLTCHLNPAKNENRDFNAENLKFFVRVPKPNQSDFDEWELQSRVLNDTTIEAIFDPTDVGAFLVDCKIVADDDSRIGVCTQTILVGFEPLPPENFNCISYNWQNLNCTWFEPQNPVKTKYELSYKDNGNSGRRKNPLAICPQKTPFNCIWDMETTPVFRQPLMNLAMVFNVTNSLKPGGQTFSFQYDLQKIVKPKPVNMTLKALDPFTISVHYTIDTNLHFFPPGFRQQIVFQSEHESTPTVEKSDLDPEIQFHNLNLTKLTPYTEYKIEARIISKEANESDQRLWSDPILLSTRTFSVAPFKSPETDVGSFEVSEDGFIYVYWKSLARNEENGPHFGYSVLGAHEDGFKTPIDLVEQTQSYAKFENSFGGNYTFHINSINKEGTSPTPSKVHVPSEKERSIQPKEVTKIAFSETLFEISWEPPADPSQSVKNYTIFWCKPKSKRDRPYQCDGEIDWKVVNKSELSVNITFPSDNIYQVAVAANTESASSGMVWTTCTILHNRVTNKVRKFNLDVVESRSLRVSWRFDCPKKILGYNITYCSLESMYSSNCSENEKFQIAQPASEYYNLEGLDPWTAYLVSISVMTSVGNGPRSEYLKNQTLMERPNTPEMLKIINLNFSRTLYLTWKPPSKLNGPIDFYEVEYSFPNFMNKMEYGKIRTSDLSLNITGVEVHTKYRFSVCACTMDKSPQTALCSHECSTKTILTGIGNSSTMQPPQATFINSTFVVVSWNDTNFHKGGPEIVYEIRLVYQRTKNQQIFRVSPPRTQLEISLEKISKEKDWSPDCQNATPWTNFYNFSIRAVTKDKVSGTIFHPAWSGTETVPAFCSNGLPTAVIITLSIVIPALVFGLLVALFKFFYWGNRTFVIFQDVSKQVSQNSRLRSSINNHVSFSQDGFELNDHIRNRYEYVTSKDSKEVQFGQMQRNNSDTTSGCESSIPSCEESVEAEQPMMSQSLRDITHRKKTHEKDPDLKSIIANKSTEPCEENNQQNYIQHQWILSSPRNNSSHSPPRIGHFPESTADTIREFNPLIQCVPGETSNGYVSLANVCRLSRPSPSIFPLDPNLVDFESIPPPAPPASYKEENFKMILQKSDNLGEIQRECPQYTDVWWKGSTDEDHHQRRPGNNLPEDTSSPRASLTPKELQVTAAQSSQPKTVIVTSYDTLLKDRKSTMV